MKQVLSIAFLLVCSVHSYSHVQLPGLLPAQKVAGNVKRVSEYLVYNLEKTQPQKAPLPLVAAQHYNDKGQMTREFRSTMVYSNEWTIKYSYNYRGEQIRQVIYIKTDRSYPNENNPLIDSTVQTTSYEYNPDSTVKSTSNDNGKSRVFNTYNDKGQLVLSQGKGYGTNMQYHSNGTLSETKIYAPDKKLLFTYKYDTKGRIIEWRTPEQKNFYYSYSKPDDAGNWTEMTCSFINTFEQSAGTTPEYGYTIRRVIEYYK